MLLYEAAWAIRHSWSLSSAFLRCHWFKGFSASESRSPCLVLLPPTGEDDATELSNCGDDCSIGEQGEELGTTGDFGTLVGPPSHVQPRAPKTPWDVPDKIDRGN